MQSIMHAKSMANVEAFKILGSLLDVGVDPPGSKTDDAPAATAPTPVSPEPFLLPEPPTPTSPATDTSFSDNDFLGDGDGSEHSFFGEEGGDDDDGRDTNTGDDEVQSSEEPPSTGEEVPPVTVPPSDKKDLYLHALNATCQVYLVQPFNVEAYETSCPVVSSMLRRLPYLPVDCQLLVLRMARSICCETVNTPISDYPETPQSPPQSWEMLNLDDGSSSPTRQPGQAVKLVLRAMADLVRADANNLLVRHEVDFVFL
jgi:hypothetical protein